MKYSSIDEVWGCDMSNNNDVPVNNRHFDNNKIGGFNYGFNNDMKPLNQNNMDNTFEGFENKVEKYAPMSDKDDDIANISLKCGDVIDHIRKCKECREKILSEFSVKNNDDVKETIKETFSNIGSNLVQQNNANNYTDVLILISLGIFIIYVLDSVMKLGKRIK